MAEKKSIYLIYLEDDKAIAQNIKDYLLTQNADSNVQIAVNDREDSTLVEADIILLIISEDSLKSQRVMGEFKEGLDLEKEIIPVLIKNRTTKSFKTYLPAGIKSDRFFVFDQELSILYKHLNELIVKIDAKAANLDLSQESLQDTTNVESESFLNTSFEIDTFDRLPRNEKLNQQTEEKFVLLVYASPDKDIAERFANFLNERNLSVQKYNYLVEIKNILDTLAPKNDVRAVIVLVSNEAASQEQILDQIIIQASRVGKPIFSILLKDRFQGRLSDLPSLLRSYQFFRLETKPEQRLWAGFLQFYDILRKFLNLAIAPDSQYDFGPIAQSTVPIPLPFPDTDKLRRLYLQLAAGLIIITILATILITNRFEDNQRQNNTFRQTRNAGSTQTYVAGISMAGGTETATLTDTFLPPSSTPSPTFTLTPSPTATVPAVPSLTARVDNISPPNSAPNGGCYATLAIEVTGRATITATIYVGNGAADRVVGTAIFPLGVSAYTVTLGDIEDFIDDIIRIETEYGESINVQATCIPIFTETPIPTFTRTPTPTNTRISTVDVTPSITEPSATNINTVVESSNCFGTLPSRLVVGVQGRVAIGLPIYIRTAPSVDGSRIAEIPSGAVFMVVAGPICDEVSQLRWWQVEYDGIVGFIGEGDDSSYWLEPVQRPTPSANPIKTFTPTAISGGNSTTLVNTGSSYRVAFDILDESGNKLGQGEAYLYAPSEMQNDETVEIRLDIEITQPEPAFAETFAFVPSATPDIRPTEMRVDTPTPPPLADAGFIPEIYEYMGARLEGRGIDQFSVRAEPENPLQTIQLQGTTRWQWFLTATEDTTFDVHELEVVIYYEKTRVDQQQLLPSEEFTHDVSTLTFKLRVVEPEKTVLQEIGDTIEGAATWVQVLAGMVGGLTVIGGGGYSIYRAYQGRKRRQHENIVKNLPPDVFISYRREDSRGSAGRLYDHLITPQTRKVVFRDVDNIAPGENFEAAIEKAIRECNVVLVVIGKKWLTVKKNKQRRLDDPKDYVRLEVATALQQKKTVIPVLVDGAKMPTENDLPDVLKPLAICNAVELRDSTFKQDIAGLLEKLSQ